MSIVTYHTNGTVAVITLTNGANQQDLAFANAMHAALDQAEADKAIKAIVITSNDEKNFSQGIHLNWLMTAIKDGRQDDVRAFMYAMNRVFARLLTIPVPVIAAITGHAFGNGAMLACACDFRFMRMDRGYFCFPEVDISIPFLPGMIAFVKKAMPYHRFNELKLTGRRATAEEMARDHVIEAAFPDAEATFEGAMEFARSFNKRRAIFGEHKQRLHKHILAVMEEEDTPLIEDLKLTV